MSYYDEDIYCFNEGQKVETNFGPGTIYKKLSTSSQYLVRLSNLPHDVVKMHISHIRAVKTSCGLLPGQHKYKLGEKVYCSKLDSGGEKGQRYVICGLLSAPAYSMHYTLYRDGDKCAKKMYAREFEVSKYPMVKTRKELYGLLGTEATKIIRQLRDHGTIEINLPANEREL